MAAGRPLCGCHDEPMLWHTDSRYTAGGFHSCAVQNRERARLYYEANRERVLQRHRDRYDADPVYRIEKQLTTAARKRRQTIERRRLGPLQV